MTQKDDNFLIFGEYFKLIQDNIKRMNKNSFLIKAWSISIFAGIFVLTYSFMNIIIMFMTIFIINIFWALDSYYLGLERLFRLIYNKKVEEFNSENSRIKMKIFEININKYKNEVKHFTKIMFSKSEFLFYISLIIIIILFSLLISIFK